MHPLYLLDTARVLLSLLMLIYASWVDLQTREIYDLVWLVFGGLGLSIALYEVYIGTLPAVWLALPVLFSSAISIALGYLGLFGGADVGAFIALSLLHPVPPRGLKPALSIVSIVYPLTLFSNSALSGASYSLVILAKNLSHALQGRSLFTGLRGESIWKKVVVLATGQRIGIDSVKGPPFQYPIEFIKKDGSGRTLNLRPNIQDDDAALKAFKRLEVAEVKEIWVSHTLPFILFIMVGYIAALTLGDIALFLLKPFLSDWI
ncbi:MAG: A24 family peptidase C-terminal domain-containing protein [Candidatus Bathyarchaeota archaeon]